MVAPTSATLRLVLVDDRFENLDHWRGVFTHEEFDVIAVTRPEDVLATLEDHRTAVLVSDVCIPGDGQGIELVRAVKARHQTLPCVLYTAFGSSEEEARAFESGASDYVVLSVFERSSSHVLVNVVHGAIAGLRTHLKRTRGGAVQDADSVVAASRAMKSLVRKIHRIAPDDRPVLIMGETGTGKELIARALHVGSARAEKPYEIVNCGAIPPGLAEATFFGHAKGAFTGSFESRPGLVEAADGGTLFLDELGELPETVQTMLLRFIETGEFRRVGENRTRHVSVRILAATNRALDLEALAGRFRHDMFWRIAQEVCRIPPLRERPEDLIGFVDRWCSSRDDGSELHVTSDAVERLLSYSWPGNIRELRHVLNRAARLSFQNTIDARAVDAALNVNVGSPPAATDIFSAGIQPPAPRLAHQAASSPASQDDADRQRVEQALAANRYHIGRTATSLGISRSTLYRLLRRLGLHR
jgi:DNA-binding NtrC family response regulator